MSDDERTEEEVAEEEAREIGKRADFEGMDAGEWDNAKERAIAILPVLLRTIDSLRGALPAAEGGVKSVLREIGNGLKRIREGAKLYDAANNIEAAGELREEAARVASGLIEIKAALGKAAWYDEMRERFQKEKELELKVFHTAHDVVWLMDDLEEPGRNMSNEDKPEKADKYFWRLVDYSQCAGIGPVPCGVQLQRYNTFGWLDEGSYAFDLDLQPEGYELALLNALLAADALDWSGLSEETKGALWMLGINVPQTDNIVCPKCGKQDFHWILAGAGMPDHRTSICGEYREYRREEKP